MKVSIIKSTNALNEYHYDEDCMEPEPVADFDCLLFRDSNADMMQQNNDQSADFH